MAEAAMQPSTGFFVPSEKRLEIVTVLLLGLTALITAWASFQASQWNSVSDNRYAAAGILQDQATTARETGFAVFEEDQTIFFDYIRAERTGDTKGATVTRTDLMTKRLRDAVDAWEKSPPQGRETTPFFDKYGYSVDKTKEADQRFANSRAAIGHARSASTTGGNYALAAVMLAAGLFLLGISGTLTIVRIRMTLIGLGMSFLIGTSIWLVTLPIKNPL